MQQPPIQSTPAGAFRFNTDSSKLEYYDGNQWVNITSTSPEVQTGGTRAVYQIGYDGSGYTDNTSFINMATTGNGAFFGNLHSQARGNGCFGYSSRTRGLFGCGYKVPTSQDNIDFCTIASTGAFQDFGDAVKKVEGATGFSDSTSGIHSFGFQRTDWAYQLDLQVTTIATTGSTVDSGFDANNDNHSSGAACSSPVRGIFAGGNPGPSGMISHMAIQTLGNTADFGDLTTSENEGPSMASNAVRGIYFAGSPNGSSTTNTISYITLATLGNAVDFGDGSTTNRFSHSSAASSTRVCRAGGYAAPTSYAIIDYVQIMTTGNSIDFGDMNEPLRGAKSTFTNGHGGLG